MWPQIKRFAGSSAGGMTASLLAVGYNSQQIEEFLSQDLSKIFLGKINYAFSTYATYCYIPDRLTNSLVKSCLFTLRTRYFFNLHYAVNLQLRLRAKTKANPERGRANPERGRAKSEQGRAKSEQRRASWKLRRE